jgi:hypothetical protein
MNSKTDIDFIKLYYSRVIFQPMQGQPFFGIYARKPANVKLKDITGHKARIGSNIHPVREKAFQLLCRIE